MRDSKGRFLKGHKGFNKKSNSGSFKKGDIPHNKGLTGYTNKGSFKVGHKPLKGGYRFPKGHMSWNRGKTYKLPERLGSKNPAWKGGPPICKVCKEKKLRYGSEYCKKCYKKEYHHWWKGGADLFSRSLRQSPEYQLWRE